MFRSFALGFVGLMAFSSAHAANTDWTGTVKAAGGYVSSEAFEVDVDVLYGGTASQPVAWGTMHYGREAERIYAHPICVGILENAHVAVVSGRVAKYFGGSSDWITFEFDIPNQAIRVFGPSTEAEALAYCQKPSGSFPGHQVYGYVIVR